MILQEYLDLRPLINKLSTKNDVVNFGLTLIMLLTNEIFVLIVTKSLGHTVYSISSIH